MKKILFTITIVLFYQLSISFPQNAFFEVYSDTVNHKQLNTNIGITAGTYAAGLSFLGFIWYKDKQRVPFHLYNDLPGYLQMDKAGHAYGAYHESYAVYYALRRSGLDKKRALLYGGPFGLIFQTPIEIFDGLYEGWGFSWTDMAANTIGAGLFTIQEALFDEQVFLMKFSYSPSIYPDYHPHLGETPIKRFFLDYNGHTYWLSGNLNKLTGIKKIPSWLNIAFGYSGNGMIYEFNNPTYYNGKPFPYFERYRQYIFTLDVDFSRIPTHNPYVKTLFKALNLIKIPFPAIEVNKTNGIQFRYLYF